MVRPRFIQALAAFAGFVAFCLAPITICSQQNDSSTTNDWAPFVESEFPFFSSVLDARNFGPSWPTKNLTPRGLILNLGHQLWACFDTEMLRVSAVWEGNAVTPVSMSQGSYSKARALVKAPEGQGKLPHIAGKPWLATGLYPGWQKGLHPNFIDPREPGPDSREVGRGPLPHQFGRFRSIHLQDQSATLTYEIATTLVRDQLLGFSSNGLPGILRKLEIAPHSEPLLLILGNTSPSAPPISLTPDAPAELSRTNDILFLRISPSTQPQAFTIVFGPSPSERVQATPVPRRWPQVVTTRATLAPPTNAYVIDQIELPLNNPWRRNVRLADLAFFEDGRAAAVTFDGDVWLVSGLLADLQQPTWSRFTSGLHEPMGIVIRNSEIFVFDRNGLWRLLDRDNNGEADQHELFCNLFTQTAETREFACGVELAPDGSFIIAKGGQQSATVGRHNGSILRISPDGSRIETLGFGLRQPFIGVHPATGLITASDQQGHYIPATPLHIISNQQYYGFIPTFLPKEQYPAAIADPLTWIPHPINASGAGQVWWADSRAGALAGSLLHLGYYRPELFLVLVNHRNPQAQAAVLSLSRSFDFPLLNGSVNPADGHLYLTGFQIWGNTAPQISGLARFRPTDRSFLLPRQLVPMSKGILLEFDLPLDPASIHLGNFSAERWNYKRTPEYGSAHYKLDGSKGQETLTPSAVYLSKDANSLFVAIPDMRPVMQMRLGWTIKSATGLDLVNNAYFTPYHLATFSPFAEGFAPIDVVLTSPSSAAPADHTPITIEEGHRLAELMGCFACHSIDGSTLGKVGPSWKGIYRSTRKLADNTAVPADEDYLRQSIRQPSAKVVAGYDKSDTGMPSYEGVLTDDQIEALVLYIKSLQ